MNRWAIALVIAFAVSLAGCGSSGVRVPTPTSGVAATGAPLVVFAAASLRDPVEDAARRFEDAHPGLAVQVNFGSSTALRTQIEQGASVDVFLSADHANAAALVATGLAPGPPVVFARTSLAIVAPADDPARIAGPLDLARPGVKLIAAADGVPLAAYAASVLEALASRPGYPSDFAAAVRANVVTREVDARAVLAKVELGEGDAALVYATDARRSGLVRVLVIPADANVTVAYVGIVLAAAPRRADAGTFLAWLTGPDGGTLFSELGYEAGP